MTNSASLSTESSDGLIALFDILVDHAEELHNADISFEATAAKPSTLGSGLSDITQIILAIGSAGGFTALVAILRSYFDNRPNGRITLSVRSKGKSMVLTADHISSDQVAQGIGALFK